MYIFLSRGINRSELNRNTAGGGHAEKAATVAENDHVVLIPCAPSPKAAKVGHGL